jgi:hypothetical protein
VEIRERDSTGDHGFLQGGIKAQGDIYKKGFTKVTPKKDIRLTAQHLKKRG